MSKLYPNRSAARTKPVAKDTSEKLRRSRQRLLDLTLRNRLLNFRPGDPQYSDDQKAHKHIVLKGIVDSLWRTLVEDEKHIEIVGLTRDQQAQLVQELRFQSRARPALNQGATLSIANLGNDQWEDVHGSVRGVSQFLQKGNLVSLLSEEPFRRRLTRIRNEQNTLANSTGDSALFLAIGFLEWCEAEPHPRANEPLFAPLALVHVALDQRRTEEGGERDFLLHMDADEAQGNPCLAEKLREDFSIDLPDIDLEANETATAYFARVGRALRTKKLWRVHPTIALGFFNFARYRLWLDLDPGEWPEGQSPTDHPIVGAILSSEPLPSQDSVPDEDAVANHQETDDLPIVMDADSTQYAALLAAQKDISLVVQGPPGSGKSQTITNLIAIALSQGKRVLFVAQKLPALQVVQRRLESVDLSPFCLPLFSDKARVTEIHKHLASSARLRENPDWRRTHHNPVVALAKKLNEHAARLRAHPDGFDQSVCSLIQRAVALHLMLREAWGQEWHDDLLNVTVLDREHPADWLEKRVQLLNQWHRLKAEVGKTWSNWKALKLGPMDAKPVETVVRRLERAALSLAESLLLLPEEFHQLTVSSIEQLASQVRHNRFVVLTDVLPSLLEFLWQTPDNAAAVARLERDLEEFSRQLSTAQRHLRITAENRQYVASRATEALDAVAPVVNPRCSLASAKRALLDLDEIVRWAEDMSAYANLSAKGVEAIFRVEGGEPDQAELTWRHVDLLANHHVNADLNVPAGAKLLLAYHVREDATRQSETRALAEQLSRFHASSKRLESRLADLGCFQQVIRTTDFEQTIHCLCQHSLGVLRLCDLADLEACLAAFIASLRDVRTVTPSGFTSAVFGRELPTLGDYHILAILADVPGALLQVPHNGTENVLVRAIGMTSASAMLKELSVTVHSHQRLHQEAVGWFPEIQLGRQVDVGTIARLTQAVSTATELGLHSQSLGSITQLVERIQRLRRAVEVVRDAFERHFALWPLLPPASLDQTQQAKSLFLLLVNRPQAASEFPIESLCLPANAQAVAAAAIEGRELQQFRQLNSERVAFRDLPDAETLAALRHELRSCRGAWWRWFSGRYRNTLNAARMCFNRPFPPDEEMLELLAELEAHERRRVAFQDSPVNTLLGGLFRGIETNWQTVEPTLAWLHELQTATQVCDITPFAQSSIRDADGLRGGIRAVDILTQLLEQDRGELGALEPLALLTLDPQLITLNELSGALNKAEALAIRLSDQTQMEARYHPHVTFVDFGKRVAQLEEFHRATVSLEKFTDLVDPRSAATLQPSALIEDAAWISELSKLAVPSAIVAALVRRELTRDTHSALIESARRVARRAEELNGVFPDSKVQGWLTREASTPTLEATLMLLARSASQARIQARECTFVEELRVSEVAEALQDMQEVEEVTEAFAGWRDILHENPATVTAENCVTTLGWLEALRRNGATGSLLGWILEGESDSRLHWWQELVNRARAFQSRIRTLQSSFAFPLGGKETAMTLSAWSSQMADRIAKTTSALEVIESYSQSADFKVQDLAQATAGLSRAIELQGSLQGWQERLGVDATRIDVPRVQNHRRWAAAVHGLPPTIELWLLSNDTTARCETLSGIEGKLVALKAAIHATEECLESFGSVHNLGPFEILSVTGTPRDVCHRCSEFVANIPVLPHYAALLREQSAAKKLGLASLLKHSENAQISTETLIHTFHGAVAWQQAKAIWEGDDELRYFQSSEHERLRRKFQDDDDKQLKANRRFIRLCLGNGDVTQGSRGRTAGEHTDYALLQHEMAKQRRHLPIRKLVRRAGRAMQDLCPCWMMTPLAVAQFLAPGTIHFDLVIMDEASQINPEDAWGAIARGKQLIVVGDQKQMPPSDFFMSALEEDESADDDDEIDGGKSESILDASVASLLSSPLLWHYRSRHETLIAPANSFSYDNRLILFPHPHRTHPELGIRYNYIENGTTTSGKVINAMEAEAVANRVRELVLHEYAKPARERLTIGVVTMNLPQQDAVIDLLDRLREDDRRFDLAMTALVSELNEEPLFVRNLENIQGDERDIMLLSCTYGPHAPGGAPTQRFGPLNREGGERRFNVLITRAKWRMEIFASIRSEQVLVDGKGQGVRDFHLFLKYAESGVRVEPGEVTGRPSDSPFEVQVEAVLRRAGYETERQVGVAGYFIDLAIKHPNHPGLFALGVECDGDTYHSSRAARDRDRLRERVLLDRGWKLHRIWSTDWFATPQQATKRLIDAVQSACR